MNVQTRTLLAIVICVVIWLAWGWFMPPVPPPQIAEKAAVVEPSETEVGSTVLPLAGDETPVPGAAPKLPRRIVEPARFTIANGLLALEVVNQPGLIVGAELRSERFQRGGEASTFLNLAGASTLELGFAGEGSDIALPRGVYFEVRDVGPQHVSLAYEGDGFSLLKTLRLLEGYEARLEIELRNHSRAPKQQRLQLRTRLGEGAERSQYDVHRGLCRTQEDLEVADMSDVEEGAERYPGPVLWGGVDRKYFLTAIVPQTPAASCEVAASEDRTFLVQTLTMTSAALQPGQNEHYVFGIYFGAKELERLQHFGAVSAADVDLEDAIDWGWFGGLSRALGRLMLHLLRWFHSLTGTWGVAILFLTVVIKLVTLPLTLKQYYSMRRMREVQPQLDQIKKKYENDRTRQAQEMQALFARSGVNPLAGCLPMLIQLPVWFALYSTLSAAPELLHVPFLWLPDLTKQDPYFILPVAIGGLMVLQNRLMPTAMDPVQQKMMNWFMPIMFTLFMLFLPSGLGVYIFVNMLLSIIQTAIQVRPATTAAAKTG